MIRKKFGQTTASNNDNFEILDDYYKLSLLCPLSKKRIEIPARGSNCQHLECFDLKTYLTLFYDYLSWNASCPICKQAASYQNIRIDSFISKIITDSNGLNQINIDKDCQWHRIVEDESKKNDDEIEVIDLELEKTQLYVDVANQKIHPSRGNILNDSIIIVDCKEGDKDLIAIIETDDKENVNPSNIIGPKQNKKVTVKSKSKTKQSTPTDQAKSQTSKRKIQEIPLSTNSVNTSNTSNSSKTKKLKSNNSKLNQPIATDSNSSASKSSKAVDKPVSTSPKNTEISKKKQSTNKNESPIKNRLRSRNKVN